MLRADDAALHPPSGCDPHQANPVLRLVRGPTGHDWTILCCGLDGLDVGLGVVHTSQSNRFLERLLTLRQQARESRREAEFPDQQHPGKVFASAGKPMYQVHLQVAGLGDLFFRVGEPIPHTPDVFASFASRDLWLSGGADRVLLRTCAWLNEQGFQVQEAKPSRCDVCMDIEVPGGLTQDLLDRYLCSDAQRDHSIRDQGKLEGYCLGSRTSGIYARIYDKTKEMSDQSHKWWFWDIWQRKLRKDVWRFEFELKRSFFRDLNPPCNDVGSLLARLPDIWEHLAGTYLTFREDNGKRTGRRARLPISDAMVAVGRLLLGCTGTPAPIDRRRGHQGSWEHAVRDFRRVAVRAGALAGVDGLPQAVGRLQGDLLREFDPEAFAEDVQRKRREYLLGPDGQPLRKGQP